MIDVLAKAAEDDDVWMKAGKTSRVFSRKGGVEVAENAEIILEQVFVRSGSGECPLRINSPAPDASVRGRSSFGTGNLTSTHFPRSSSA